MLASRARFLEDFAGHNDFLDSPAPGGRYVIKGPLSVILRLPALVLSFDLFAMCMVLLPRG